MAEPVTAAGAIAALAGSVTAVLKLLSRRSRLSAWVRRRQEEDKARDEAFLEIVSLLGGWAGHGDEIREIRKKLAARLEEIARAHERRPLAARWRKSP